MKTGSILIVDDDADVLLTAELVLKTEFRRVATESDPHRLPAALRERFDVVLLDMNFSPGQTTGQEGVDCLRTIEQLSPDTKVILVVGRSSVSRIFVVGGSFAMGILRVGDSDPAPDLPVDVRAGT